MNEQIHGGEHRKNLMKLLQEVGRRHNLWNVFEDFMRVAAISIANSSDPFHVTNSAETWESREKRYLETIGRYRKEEQMVFPQMMTELVLELEHQVRIGEFTDVLGELFHDMELHNKWRGQFFTPQSVCDMMGAVTMDKETMRRTVETFGYVSVNEPSCGSGATLMGFLNAFRGEGFNYSKEALVVGQDVDERCVHMAYIQFSLYGVPAILSHMNTLSLETYGEPWYSPVYILDMWHWKRKRRHGIELQEQELYAMING